MCVTTSFDIEAQADLVWASLVEPDRAKQSFDALKKYGRIEFPYGPIGSIIGWSAAWTARKTGDEIPGDLKHLSEASA